MDLFAFKTLLLLLSFIGRGAGENVLPDGPVDAILGKNVTLKTLLDKASYAVILWNFSDGTVSINVATVTAGGVKEGPTYTGRVTVNTTNGYLTLMGLKSEDSGDYSISMVTDAGTKTGETKLRVLEPVSEVKIVPSLAEAIEHNSTVDLTCSAKGSFLEFTWLKGATPIVIDGKRLTVKKEELSSTLTIRDVLRSDFSGPIYCVASNKLETEKSPALNYTVFYGPEQVTLSPMNPPKFIRSKSDFNLTCSARSSPPARFSWYHGTQQLELGEPVLPLAFIERFKLGKKQAEYRCHATNAKTQRVISSPTVTFAVMDPITGVKLDGPKAVLIAGNSSANLSCQALGGTVQTTTWLKDGKPLASGGRVLISADKSSVLINPLQKEDNGVYVCELVNPVTTVRDSYKMLVNYGPEAVMVVGESAVEMNDQVLLTCSAASVPAANFTWKFNGTLTEVKTAQYKIEMARFKNSGTYTCEAHNAVTGARSSYTHTLSVKEEGELDGLSDGAIAGIVIAVLVALGAAIGLIMYCRQKVPVESPY